MRTKTWAAVACAGLLAGGVVVAQPPKGEPAKSAPAAVEHPKVGGESLVTVLGDAQTALGKLRDYSCTFTRQEMVKDKIGAEQVAEMKVRTKPVGVYVRFARPSEVAGMEVAYSAARKTMKMRYRPAGAAGAKGFHSIDLDDEKFLAANRHPVTEWTMAAVLDRISAATAREKTLNNPVEVYAGEYQFAGKNVTRYEVLTRRQHAFRYAYRMLIYVDKDTKMLVRYEAYDQPKSGAAVGDLLEAYSFTDMKANPGVGESTFDS
ncbi:DUF1571 domain-containing protein [Frigoriglobus tundricola]|uniref:Outer membrane lipoprotein-sorting protein n=1 Tax=Frigoriglobus tundricola TaxID=2774151 RepID=A0A6M5YWV6_9BACT|nr:DUF1571 domain-containing protein [Frigoriglobus tundricola]QJW97422.1 hypothetical protein FTUN_4996 [Frigoriglobus tundricola]